MTPEVRHAVAITHGHIAIKRQLRTRVLGTVSGLWDRLGSYYDADIRRFTPTAVALVAAGQRQMAASTAAYLAHVLALAGADTGTPIDPADFTGDQVRNVDPLEEYRRPGIEVWAALSAGVALDAAIARGRARALSLASTDLQLAATNAAQAQLQASPHVVGYERVPTGDHSCALCLVASTQRYHRGDLMPIHPGCSCDVAPIVGTDDPGRILDHGLLDQTRDTVRATFGAGANVDDPELLRTAIAVQDHGEYGPTLTMAGQHFTGAADIAA